MHGPFADRLRAIALAALATAGCDLLEPELCCESVAPTCYEPTATAGEACDRDDECERELACFDGSCRAPAAAGEGCDTAADCSDGLECSCDAGCIGVCHEPGSLALGEPCLRGESCASGACNVVTGSVCTTASGVDEPCLAQSDCAPGLVCSWAYEPHVCREPEREGGPCYSARECAEGHVCEWNDDQTEKRCVERVVRVGDPCAIDECGQELACNVRARTCAEPPGAGEPCLGIRCRVPLSCNYGLSTPVCVELGSADVGEPCSGDELCVPGAWCGGEVCRTEAFRGAGETCDEDRECESPLRCEFARR